MTKLKMQGLGLLGGVFFVVVLISFYPRVKAIDGQPVAAESTAPRFEPVQRGAENFQFMVEHAPNGEFLTFHVSTPVTTALIEDLETSQKNKGFLRDLSGIHGIRGAWLRPHQVIVMKDERYQWSDIRFAVEAVIKLHLEPRQSVPK